MLKIKFPKLEIFDLSNFFYKMGKNASEYYPKYLALFIKDGILCENFLEDGREGVFTKKVFIPAFERVCKYFGIKPLIVRSIPKDENS